MCAVVSVCPLVPLQQAASASNAPKRQALISILYAAGRDARVGTYHHRQGCQGGDPSLQAGMPA